MRDVKNFIKSGVIVVFNDFDVFLVCRTDYDIKAYRSNLWFVREKRWFNYCDLLNPRSNCIYSIDDITRVYETKWALNLEVLEYQRLTDKIKDTTCYNSRRYRSSDSDLDLSEYDNNEGLKEVWIKEIEENISSHDALLDVACENITFLKNVFPLLSVHIQNNMNIVFYDDNFNIPPIQNDGAFIKYMLSSERFRKTVKEELLLKTCYINKNQILEYFREKENVINK